MTVATKTRQMSGKPIPLPEAVWQRIAETAYALDERRGRHDGYDLQDRLDAEYLVNELPITIFANS